MTFDPVVPGTLLVAVAALIVALRALSLRQALRRSAGGHFGPAVLRWTVLTLAMLSLVLAAARPVVGTGTPRASADGGVNVFFVVDRSAASRVEDFGDGASRMAGIRGDMAALVDQYPDGRFAVISFASSSDLDWPLSEDVWSIKPMIAGLSPYPSTSPSGVFDVDAAAASDILRYELDQAGEQFPGAKNLVFYLGSGAAGSRAPQGNFDVASASVAGGAVLGYGSLTGGPVPAQMVDGRVVYLADVPGGPALQAAIDESRLRTIAEQLGLPYVHRDSGQNVTTALTPMSDSPTTNAASGSKRIEVYWVLSLAAAAFLLAEIYLTIRGYRRNRVLRHEVEQ